MNDLTKITTPDLYFAAYLRTKNCLIVDIKKEGTKTIFVFDISNTDLEPTKLKQGFFNISSDDPESSVVSIAFANSIRTLKTLCHILDDESGSKIQTPDLYFAAYLKTKGCTVERIKQDDSKTVFVFNIIPSNMSLLELKFGYFNSVNNPKCTVCASTYTDAVRSLKTMCHLTTDN